MKIILLLCLISINSLAQTIKTKQKDDPRRIQYLDSLIDWRKEELLIAQHYNLLNATHNLLEFDDVSKKLGYGGSVTVVKPDKKYKEAVKLDDDKRIYDTVIHAEFGDGSWTRTIFHSRIHPKPVVKVVYRPKIQHKISPLQKKVIVHIDSIEKSKNIAIEWYTNHKLDSNKLYTIKIP